MVGRVERGWRRRVWACAGIALLGGPALASDGEIEINQARAEAGAIHGSLADDPPGFPVRIVQPGSYRLTSDLDVPNVQLGGISIAAGIRDVTIDLGGFTIRGASGVEVNAPVWACTGGGNGFGGPGIAAEDGGGGQSAHQITIRNGRVRKMGAAGIDLGISRGVQIERVDAERNCGDGIQVGNDATVISSRARANRFNGIFCANRCQILDSAAEENREIGVATFGSSLLRGILARGNGSWGIVADAHSRVEASVSVANGANGEPQRAGIRVTEGSLVMNTIANDNQGGYGIAATSQSTIALTVETGNVALIAPLMLGCRLAVGDVACPPRGSAAAP